MRIEQVHGPNNPSARKGNRPSGWERDRVGARTAAGLLLTSASELAEVRGLAAPRPKIRTGPLGSIDLLCRTPSRELLINVPANADEPADYYGDDRSGGHVVKGTLDPEEANDWLLVWLTKPLSAVFIRY